MDVTTENMSREDKYYKDKYYKYKKKYLDLKGGFLNRVMANADNVYNRVNKMYDKANKMYDNTNKMHDNTNKMYDRKKTNTFSEKLHNTSPTRKKLSQYKQKERPPEQQSQYKRKERPTEQQSQHKQKERSYGQQQDTSEIIDKCPAQFVNDGDIAKFCGNNQTYRNFSLIVHPDKNIGCVEIADKKMKECSMTTKL